MDLSKKAIRFLLKSLLIMSVGGLPFLLSGCAPASAGADSSKHAAIASQDVSPLENSEQRLSYALGMVLGNQFREQSVRVDPGLYLEGFEAALSGGSTRLSRIEARTVMNQFQQELKRKQLASSVSAAVPTGIEVSFKLDPRLTRSMYMGDRWVSPPTFTIVQVGREAVIEARAHGTNSKGKSLQIRPEWTPEDPEMLAVVPDTGGEVRIMVRSAGRTSLKVEVPGISKTYTVRANYLDDSIQVEISQ